VGALEVTAGGSESVGGVRTGGVGECSTVGGVLTLVGALAGVVCELPAPTDISAILINVEADALEEYMGPREKRSLSSSTTLQIFAEGGDTDLEVDTLRSLALGLPETLERGGELVTLPHGESTPFVVSDESAGAFFAPVRGGSLLFSPRGRFEATPSGSSWESHCIREFKPA
jgi:hypothetical protein